MEDSKIIELFFERSEQAIKEMSGKYGSVCMKIAENILNDRLDAEECVNDAYLVCWNNIPPERPDPLISYVCRIVRNQALKKYHQKTAQKRNNSYDISLDELVPCFPSTDSVEKEFEAREVAEMIDLFLESLDEKSRIMFVRRYWYSDTIEEIATMFHTSKHYISVRLSRIRKGLKKYLEKEGIVI